MKLSNLSVIFIIIAIPIILILSYYISLQRDTINLQISYDTKLLESTKEAIEAFEINTVEWNEAYSETADSKRRDVMASINTFTTSLANNLDVSGTSKEYLLSHIPAIAFTLYDGCYIYSPSETKYTVKDKNGVTVFMNKEIAEQTGYTAYNSADDDGKILYQLEPGETPEGTYEGIDFTLDPTKALKTNADDSQNYPYILKPFTAYSETVTNGNDCNMVINYTLDNYVTIYGREDNTSDSEYISKSGYLNLISSTTDGENIIKIEDTNFEHAYKFAETGINPIDRINFSGQEIEPELLSETIAYKYGNTITTKKFNYVYEAERDTKVYYDEGAPYDDDGDGNDGAFFRLNGDLEKIYVRDLTEPLYKKCTIPTELDGEKSYIKVYQNLVNGKWYVKGSGGTYILVNDGDLDTQWDELLYKHSDFTNKIYDYSAINYCVETYVFTNWVNKLGLEYKETYVNGEGTIVEKTGTTAKTLNIEGNNDPEDEYSEFTKHKREVIKNTIISNLNQAITSYSKHSKDEYKLPKLQETEWDQVLSNVSIITFLQNIPIGLKYYNNYAIATSTFNKEYVDPNEIYLYDRTSSDYIYHSPYCEKLADTDNELIGYRSIDYMYKYYDEEDSVTGDKSTKYYFKHEDTTNKATQSCYYCLVQRALYEKDETNYKKDAYYTALARERYLQLDSIIIEDSDIDVTKTITKPDGSPISELDYGDTIKYTIQVNNKGSASDTINIVDWYDGNKIKIQEATISKSGYIDGNLVFKDKDHKYLKWTGVSINPGEEIEITFNAAIEGNIGETLTNYVGIYKYSTGETEIDTAEVECRIEKTVDVHSSSVNTQNILLVLDTSNSMNEYVYEKFPTLSNPLVIPSGLGKGEYPNAVRNFIEEVETKGSTIKGAVLFAGDTNKFVTYQDLKTRYDIWNTDQGTWYGEALERALENIEGVDILVFFSDGNPTIDYIFTVPYEWNTHPWPRIRELSTQIKNKGVTIYTVGYGNAHNLEGLKEVIASDENKALYGYNINNLFEDLANSIPTPPAGIPSYYKSEYGILNLQYVNKIKDIQINGSSLTNFQSYIESKDETDSDNIKGILDLKKIEGISGNAEIKIIY